MPTGPLSHPEGSGNFRAQIPPQGLSHQPMATARRAPYNRDLWSCKLAATAYSYLIHNSGASLLTRRNTSNHSNNMETVATCPKHCWGWSLPSPLQSWWPQLRYNSNRGSGVSHSTLEGMKSGGQRLNTNKIKQASKQASKQINKQRNEQTNKAWWKVIHFRFLKTKGPFFKSSTLPQTPLPNQARTPFHLDEWHVPPAFLVRPWVGRAHWRIPWNSITVEDVLEMTDPDTSWRILECQTDPHLIFHTRINYCNSYIEFSMDWLAMCVISGEPETIVQAKTLAPPPLGARLVLGVVTWVLAAQTSNSVWWWSIPKRLWIGMNVGVAAKWIAVSQWF